MIYSMVFELLGQHANTLIWLPLSMHLVANAAQIVKTYSVKKVGGLSYQAVALFFASIFFWTLHVYTYSFPYAHKVMVALNCIALCIMAIQTYMYSADKQTKKRIALFYASFSIFAGIYTATTIFWRPLVMGNIAGWLCLGLISIYQVPQIIKIHQLKTTEGFSFGFVFFSAFASTLELICSPFLTITLIAYLGIFRNLILRTIQFMQFYLYKK